MKCSLPISASPPTEPSLRSVVVEEEEESLNDSLVQRFLQCPSVGASTSTSSSTSFCFPERLLHSVTLHKASGSLGVMIAEGADGGLYIQDVSEGGAADKEGTLRPGQFIHVCVSIIFAFDYCFTLLLFFSVCIGIFPLLQAIKYFETRALNTKQIERELPQLPHLFQSRRMLCII